MVYSICPIEDESLNIKKGYYAVGLLKGGELKLSGDLFGYPEVIEQHNSQLLATYELPYRGYYKLKGDTVNTENLHGSLWDKIRIKGSMFVKQFNADSNHEALCKFFAQTF